MLQFLGSKSQYCDGVSRRSFLQAGVLGIGGLTLPNLLRAEAAGGVGSSQKAVINIYLGGGPSHMDMFDMKPDAPVEYRGEFKTINTNVSGMQICEHMPNLATMADKFAVIRSLVGSSSGHSPWQCHTGFDKKSLAAIGGRPSLGSVVTKLQGSADAPAPPYVSFTGDRESAGAGYLGPMYKPYLPDGPGRDNLKLTRIDAERLQGRVGLLDRIDRIRRDVDASGSMEAMDVYTQRAVSMLTSARLADALDVEKEDPAIRDRYHLEDDKNSRRGNRSTDNFLAARRLIEAGVRVVYLRWGSWDTHGDNFGKLSTQLPQLDAGLSALLTDLHERGMDKDVTVVMWGEFGRTPKVNSKGGRDHWPKVCSCFLAGGGLRMGQYIGSTDYRGELAQDRPIHFQEVHATLYHALGINPETTQLVDPAGRPQYLLERNTPIAELV